MPDLSSLPKARPSSRSGVFGVSWDRSRYRWSVRLTVAGERRRFGRYVYIGAAIAATVAALAVSLPESRL